MSATTILRPLALAAAVMLAAAGCGFPGVTSLPLPGTPGRGTGASTYHVRLADVGTLESNSPVLANDVVVGSVGSMTVDDWHADVDVTITPGIVVPANAVASVGQTSLLGSMHLSLDPPPGQAAAGALAPGSTIGLNRTSTYPSTERTLAALSLLINGGGVTQIGDIVHNTTAALHGREGQIRDVFTRLDTFVGTLNRQRDAIAATIVGLDRLTGTLAQQTTTITDALRDIPPALDVLNDERAHLTEALTKLGTLSALTTKLINDSQTDLVTDLNNLQPTLGALADVGPKIDVALALAPTFPFPQNVIDRGVRGDYLNLYAVVDLTTARLKRTILRGTRFADINTQLVPAPGDPYYLQYSYDPLHAPLNPPAPPTGDTPAPPAGPPPTDAPGTPTGGR